MTPVHAGQIEKRGTRVRGIPNNPVPCTKCSSPLGFPRLGLCNRCKPATARKKYFWKPEDEEHLRRIYADHVHYKPELSRAIKTFAVRLGWPTYIVKNKASQLRLTLDIRRSWKPQEMGLLREYAGQKPMSFFMKRLHRSHQSVRSMFDSLHLSYRISVGYSRKDLAFVFGVSYKTVSYWIIRRWLVPAQGTDRVSEAQVRRFITAHPEEYRLKRVDEAWFKGLLFPAMGLGECDKRRIA